MEVREGKMKGKKVGSGGKNYRSGVRAELERS
jgi:hypothetical protein